MHLKWPLGVWRRDWRNWKSVDWNRLEYSEESGKPGETSWFQKMTTIWRWCEKLAIIILIFHRFLYSLSSYEYYYYHYCYQYSLILIHTYYLVFFGCPRGVMVKAMNCGIVVRDYVHFRANTLGKGMNPLILPPAMGK